jgi:hypothetical protein
MTSGGWSWLKVETFLIFHMQGPVREMAQGHSFFRDLLGTEILFCAIFRHTLLRRQRWICGNMEGPPCISWMSDSYSIKKSLLGNLWVSKSTSIGSRQVPKGQPLPVHSLFWWPTGPLQTKNLCKGSLNISLHTSSYSVLPFFERAWSKGDLPN